MPDDQGGYISITVNGLDKVQRAIGEFPGQAASYLGMAGREAADRVILSTEGLRAYPPMTAANAPPTPYYIRGRGTQLARRNLYNSERLGTRWYTRQDGLYITRVGNTASYARFVHGDEQARHMAAIGWRKLGEVAREKIGEISKTYQAWIDRLIRSLGL